MATDNSTQPTYGGRRSGPKISESHSGRRSGPKIISEPIDEQMTEAATCIYIFNYLTRSSARFLLRTATFDDLNDSPQFLGWNEPQVPIDAAFLAVGSFLYAFGGFNRYNSDSNLLTNIYYLDVTKHDQGWNEIGYPMLVGRYLPHTLLIRNKIVVFDSYIFNTPFGEIHDVSFCGPARPVMPPPTSVKLEEEPFLIAPLVSSNQVLLTWAKSGIAFLYDLDSYRWEECDHVFDFKSFPARGRAIFVRNNTTLCWYINEFGGLYFYDMNERSVSWQPIIGWKDPIPNSDSRDPGFIYLQDENHIVITWGENAVKEYAGGSFFRYSIIQLEDDTDDNGDPFILCRVVSSHTYWLGEGTCFLSACQLVLPRNGQVEREGGRLFEKKSEGKLGKRKLIN